MGPNDFQEVALASALSEPLCQKVGTGPVQKAVEAALVKAGLYAKEARAMVNTWERSYFRTDGLRVLYVLPRAVTDATIPLQIQPAPDELVRVMVGRVEVLTPAKEARIEKAVADLGRRDPTARKAAEAELAHLGRLQEPILHRIATVAHDSQVRERAGELIHGGQKAK
jgi:hypothetical protein